MYYLTHQTVKIQIGLLLSLVWMFTAPALADAPVQKISIYPNESFLIAPQVSVPLKPPRFYPVPYFVFCSCINSAKYFTGHQGEVWGNAWDMKPNTLKPQVGDVVLLKDGRGHVGVIVEIKDGSITFKEWNYSPCKAGQRTIPLYSPEITGYYRLKMV